MGGAGRGPLGEVQGDVLRLWKAVCGQGLVERDEVLPVVEVRPWDAAYAAVIPFGLAERIAQLERPGERRTAGDKGGHWQRLALSARLVEHVVCDDAAEAMRENDNPAGMILRGVGDAFPKPFADAPTMSAVEVQAIVKAEIEHCDDESRRNIPRHPIHHFTIFAAFVAQPQKAGNSHGRSGFLQNSIHKGAACHLPDDGRELRVHGVAQVFPDAFMPDGLCFVGGDAGKDKPTQFGRVTHALRAGTAADAVDAEDAAANCGRIRRLAFRPERPLAFGVARRQGCLCLLPGLGHAQGVDRIGGSCNVRLYHVRAQN